MSGKIKEKINKSIQTADGLYYRLILLVGEIGSGKTKILQEVAADYQVNLLNANLTLSAQLLELSPRQRMLKMPVLFEQMIRDGSNLVILDNIEILFDKSINQDPLMLLLKSSRNHTILSSWPGRIVDRHLEYARIDHPEYRKYFLEEILTVQMNGNATID